MESWHDLFVASAGAAAALMGLLFVGLSINLAKILASSVLANRALIACMLLLSNLIQTLLLLIPHESLKVAGILTLVIFVNVWPFLFYLDLVIFKEVPKVHRGNQIFKMLLNQAALLPYLVGAVLLLSGFFLGYYWLVTSIILSFLKAAIDAWVLLIEINR